VSTTPTDTERFEATSRPRYACDEVTKALCEQQPPAKLPPGQLLGVEKMLCLCDSVECVGCGDAKTYRGEEFETMVCCHACWRRLPKWLIRAYLEDTRRPEGGHPFASTVWENRIAVILVWRREAIDAAMKEQAT